jgi:hypothetical protein
MSTHAVKEVLIVGLTIEVVYRAFVREHVRRYLGIEAS